MVNIGDFLRIKNINPKFVIMKEMNQRNEGLPEFELFVSRCNALVS